MMGRSMADPRYSGIVVETEYRHLDMRFEIRAIHKPTGFEMGWMLWDEEFREQTRGLRDEEIGMYFADLLLKELERYQQSFEQKTAMDRAMFEQEFLQQPALDGTVFRRAQNAWIGEKQPMDPYDEAAFKAFVEKTKAEEQAQMAEAMRKQDIERQQIRDAMARIERERKEQAELEAIANEAVRSENENWGAFG